MILLSLVWAVLIFVLLIMISLGSYCVLFRSTTSQQANTGRSSSLLSLCNCFACGVFLSTCFLGLMPHIREHEAKLRAMWASAQKSESKSSSILMKTELVVLAGFLLILLIEQIFHACGHRQSSSDACRNGSTSRGSASRKETGEGTGVTSSSFMSIGGDQEPLVLDSIDSEDSDDDDPSDLTPKIEFRRIDDGPDDHHGSVAHGGHSHLGLLPGAGSSLTFSSCFLLLGLSTHSLFEGVALGVQTNQTEFYGLLLAIMMHEVLCSFAFGVNLAQQRTPLRVAFVVTSLLAGCIPVGMCTSVLVNSLDSSTSLMLRFILEGLAAGTFIYVACVEMLSAELRDHASGRIGIYKVISVVTGVLVFFIFSVLIGKHSQHDVLTTAAPTLKSNIRATF